MKAFVMKHWRSIIYVISGIAILINLINVCTIPTTIIDDYYKYGPNYKYDIIDKAGNVEIHEKDVNETAEDMKEAITRKAGVSDDISRGVIITAVLICFLLIFQNVIDGNTASAKKK